MTKKKKCFTGLIAAMVMLMGLGSVSAATTTKTSTDTWKSFGITFATIQLSAQGNNTTGKVYDVWFSKSSAYYPFYITDKSTWSYTVGTTGYAKGQYTLHGSIGYKLTSDIRTETETMTLTF